MSNVNSVTPYWGVASGSTHAMFRRHYEGDPWYQDAPTPTHLMVSWRTRNNQVWKGPRWMIDSGGAPKTIIANNGHPDSIHDYIEWLRSPPTRYGDDLSEVDLERFALRDWPCEPEVQRALGLSVRELQYRTLVDHINMMDVLERENLNMEPVAVLQGWEIEDYLACIDLYRDHGLLTDQLAIGTLCGRQNTTIIENTSFRIAKNLPSRISLHGFGVKQSALRDPVTLRVFDTVDTAAWDQTLFYSTKDGIEIGPPDGVYSDWVEWDDRGNPRMTARNLWLAYRGYANRLQDIIRTTPPDTTRTVTINQLFQLVDEDPPPGMRVDQYIIAQCLCGGFIDPGRPDPHWGPICRHCERAELDIRIKRIEREDELQMGGIDATFG